LAVLRNRDSATAGAKFYGTCVADVTCTVSTYAYPIVCSANPVLSTMFNYNF